MSRKTAKCTKTHRPMGSIQPAILQRKRRNVSESEVDNDLLERQKSSKKTCDITSKKSPEMADLSGTSQTVDKNGWSPPLPQDNQVMCLRNLSSLPTPEASPPIFRKSPLPKFNWADSKEVWDLMVEKDAKYIHESTILTRHPALHPRMRSILLDWLIEVCEVYTLHRETYYLAQDYIDRYLAAKRDIPRQQLQLLGITSLFLAAKMEEIYPPKISEFAYVTDGACTENEILEKELVILTTLKWFLLPVTVNSWLNTYLQVAAKMESRNSKKNFLFPEFSSTVFIKIAQLVDLCMLDINCLQFSYSVIAASALCHLTGQAIALEVSGFKFADVFECVQWMQPFAAVIKETGDCHIRFFENCHTDELHNIQCHHVTLQLLEKAQSLKMPEKIGSLTPTSSKGSSP